MRFKPVYSDGFRCIGPACEDSCCEEWTVHVDQATYEKYQAIQAGSLRTIVDESILRMPVGEKAPGSTAPAFAQIRMNAAHKCPLLSAHGLCQMQIEHGHDYLSHACATYPRVLSTIDSIPEVALSLSCPEAARLVLLNSQLPTGAGPDEAPFINNSNAAESNPWLLHFWPIRDFALALVKNRAYPLWQRLFLLGVFGRKLDAIAVGDLREKVPQILASFVAGVASQNLQASMETLPVDHAQQLDVVLRLAGMMLHRSYIRPRFIECIQAFTQGIGNGPGATLESLTAAYSSAHDRYFAPFFQKHPHILENLLINTVFRCRFPFGNEWALKGAAPSMNREVALLTAQFALMKGLLIGVAGYHREQLCADHVVHTVQAASKHFEHHAEFLTQAHTLLVESRMDGAQGLTILLRNEKSNTPLPAVLPIHPPDHPLGPAMGTTVFPMRRPPKAGADSPGSAP
jgi:lysine-N-methylase